MSSRKRGRRDLCTALTLRPRDVYELYGIPESTLCGYLQHPDPAIRLPSILIPGRCGRRGIRLIFHEALRGWLQNQDRRRE